MVLNTTTARRMQTKPVYIASTSGLGAFFSGASNSYLSMADSAAFDFTSDFSFAARIKPTDWATLDGHIVNKYSTGLGWWVWYWNLFDLGSYLEFSGTPTGIGDFKSFPLLALSQTNPIWVGVALDADIGKLYHSWSMDGITWTIYATYEDATSRTVTTSNDGVKIGQYFDGLITDVVMYSGIGTDGKPGGTEVFRFNAVSDLTDPNATSFTASSGQTVTVNNCTIAIDDEDYRGTPVGIDDWRLIVERLNGTGSVVGACQVGVDAVVGTVDWEDVTAYVRGIEWYRGSDEPYGRPVVGEVTLTLDNRSGLFSPWIAYADTRPGTIFRAGIVSPTDTRADGWLPQWTARVDSWPVERIGVRDSAGNAADNFVNVTLMEMLVELATVDDNALGAPGGAGDTISDRVDRLLTAAFWRYGMVVEGGGYVDQPTLTLQSTDMAANRIAELYASADSTASVVRSDVTGAALVTELSYYRFIADTRLREFSVSNSDYGTVWLSMYNTLPTTSVYGTQQVLVADADSLIVNSDLEHLKNDTRYTRVGGTQQVMEHTVSIGRFGRSSEVRTDLLCANDAQVQLMAEEANNHKATTTIRVDQVTVTATGKGLYYLLVAAIDVNSHVHLQFIEPGDVGGSFSIRNMIHRVTTAAGQLHWTVTYALDTGTLAGWPDGAQLEPATPNWP